MGEWKGDVTMLDFVPAAWRSLVGDAIGAVVLVAAAWLVYFLVGRAVASGVRRERFPAPVGVLVRLLARWVIVAATLLLVLQRFGLLKNTWALVSAILAMVAIGFVAVWSLLSNVLSTVLLLAYKPFRVGDTVEIPTDNVGGKVVDLNLFFTTLKEGNGETLSIPNNAFFQKAIRTKPGEEQLDLAVQLNRSEPAE
jgi:small-conductance mechanosensitive channel